MEEELLKQKELLNQKKLLQQKELLTQNELEAVIKLYVYNDIYFDSETLEEDLNNGYLTDHIDENGDVWFWYMDSTRDVAINVKTHEMIEENVADKFLGDGYKI